MNRQPNYIQEINYRPVILDLDNLEQSIDTLFTEFRFHEIRQLLEDFFRAWLESTVDHTDKKYMMEGLRFHDLLVGSLEASYVINELTKQKVK